MVKDPNQLYVSPILNQSQPVGSTNFEVGYGNSAAGAGAGAGAGKSAAGGSAASWQTAGMIAAGSGAVLAAIGQYYAAKSQKRRMRMMASSYEFQRQLSDINARRAEAEADSRLRAGQTQVMQQTLQAGQVRASQVAGMAANGIQAGVGSFKEVLATTDLVKDVEKYNISMNAVQAANAARMQAADLRTQGTMLSAQAAMTRSAAGAISPWSGVATSLLTSGGNFAMNYAYMQRRYPASATENINQQEELSQAIAAASDPRLEN